MIPRLVVVYSSFVYSLLDDGPNPAGGSQKPQGSCMGSKDREYLKYRKGMMKKEEVTGGILVQDKETLHTS